MKHPKRKTSARIRPARKVPELASFDLKGARRVSHAEPPAVNDVPHQGTLKGCDAGEHLGSDGRVESRQGSFFSDDGDGLRHGHIPSMGHIGGLPSPGVTALGYEEPQHIQGDGSEKLLHDIAPSIITKDEVYRP